jgi:Zn-dependent protease with chaperone function
VLPATAVALGLLAALLAWPVPAGLARAGWPRRDPLTALLCWQAVGLAGGLSMIGALLVHGLAPWGHSLPEAAWSVVARHPAGETVRGDHWVALTLAGVLAAELVGVLLLSSVRTARTRRRHRELLELVVRPGAAAGGPAGETLLLEHPAPVAFCIPGARPLLVLSSGMLAELDDAQLAAVVAHERAHLSERHHLLLLPFVAWRAALPVLPAAGRAHDAVRDLVEMRADDVALGSLSGPEPRRTLAAAIVAVAGGAGGVVPAGALAVTGGAVAVRVRRLLSPPRPLSAAARWTARTFALALLLVPTVLLLAPAAA